MTPTAAQHLFAQRQMAHVPPEKQAQALEASVAFSPPDVMDPNDVLDGQPWVMHLAHAWGKPWAKTYEEAPAALHAAWAPWLPESDRAALRPCEWPVAVALRRGASLSPELLRWAVDAASDAMWAFLVAHARPGEVASWGAQALPASHLAPAFLVSRLLHAHRHAVLPMLVAAGLVPDESPAESGNTPLHAARTAQDVAALLAAGADPHRRNAAGLTPAEHWQRLPEGLQRSDMAAMVAALQARAVDAVAPHAALFQTVLDHSASSSWEKVVAAGWSEAIRQDPPVVFRDKTLDWSLLGQVARTLSKSMPVERRQDLLEHALHPRVPRALLTHESIPGVPDVLFAAAQAVRHPFRKRAALRLAAAQQRVYPTSADWGDAFVAAAVAWRTGRVKWEPVLFMTALAPLDANHALAHPCPEWLASPLSAPHAPALAPLIQEAWMTTEHKQENRVGALLTRLWDAAETEGRWSDLAPWAPALLGQAFHEVGHVGSTVARERLARWQAAGVSFAPALSAAQAIIRKKKLDLSNANAQGKLDAEEWAALVARITAHDTALALTAALPDAPVRAAGRSPRM